MCVVDAILDSSIDLLAISTVYIGPGLDPAEKARDSWLMACPQLGFKAVYELVLLSSPGFNPSYVRSESGTLKNIPF